MNSTTVLVTGGAGMIGCNLVKALRKRGNKVVVVDNLWRGCLKNLTDSRGKPMIDLKKEFYKLDLRKDGVLNKIRQHIDIVIHLADIVAGIGYVFKNEGQIFRDNLLINSNTFEWVRRNRPKALVYIGTACSFPRELQMKKRGSQLREGQLYPAHPESAYGWSKLMGTYEADLLSRETGVKVANLILHNVYGTPCDLGPRSQVIPALALKTFKCPPHPFVVWGSGRQGRAFLHVQDAVRAILLAMSRGLDKGPIQIGPDFCTSIRSIAETLVRISGKKIKIEYDKTKPEGDRARSADFRKARQCLGWSPKINLTAGLRDLYKWIELKEGTQSRSSFKRQVKKR